MKTRRLLLSLPVALAFVAVAAQKGRADAGTTDAEVADGSTDAKTDASADAADVDGGERDDESTTGCGGSAPPNAGTAFGAGCC